MKRYKSLVDGRKKTPSYLPFFCLGLMVPLLCAGCAITGGMTLAGREQAAQSIAQSAGLRQEDFSESPFVIRGWQNLNDPTKPVNLYIEGDGLAWLSKSRFSLNPTPTDPLTLRLAALDPSSNVLYLARPCQYNGPDLTGNKACLDSTYWRGKRFAPEVIKAYNAILNDLSIAYPKGFHMIGFSGGANIAGILAAQRQDILSLRTIAGNIDNDAFTRFHGVSAMPYSLNIADYTGALKNIPQKHFIGAADKIVPIDIFNSFAIRMGGHSQCIQHEVISNAGHETGWVELWPELLKYPLPCTE